MQSLFWCIHMKYACSVSIVMHANEWLCMYSSYNPPSIQLFILASQNAQKTINMRIAFTFMLV